MTLLTYLPLPVSVLVVVLTAVLCELVAAASRHGVRR
jgi:hypothetical protein